MHCLLYLVGGADTTSSTITILFYLLLCNPTANTCLREEVDAFFDRDEDIRDHTKLATLPYLNACMSVPFHLRLYLYLPFHSEMKRSVFSLPSLPRYNVRLKKGAEGLGLVESMCRTHWPYRLAYHVQARSRGYRCLPLRMFCIMIPATSFHRPTSSGQSVG